VCDNIGIDIKLDKEKKATAPVRAVVRAGWCDACCRSENKGAHGLRSSEAHYSESIKSCFVRGRPSFSQRRTGTSATGELGDHTETHHSVHLSALSWNSVDNGHVICMAKGQRRLELLVLKCSRSIETLYKVERPEEEEAAREQPQPDFMTGCIVQDTIEHSS
jgi:hypothetical protein